MANYGLRPTFDPDNREPVLEVHCLVDPDEAHASHLGESLSVDWLHYFREEHSFASHEALRAQIALDKQAAMQFFALA